MTRTEELKALLDSYDNAYYNLDSPTITDVEYDILKQEYLKLTGEEEYSYVPGEALFNKVNHIIPVKSLGKLNISEQDKLKAKIQELWPVIIEPKLDGLTLVVYDNEDNSRYVTRGNGLVGEDVTKNCKSIKGLGCMPGNIVRGEVIMLISEFNRINKEREAQGLELFKNPRNAAAGMLRNKDVSKVQGLTYIAYNILNTTSTEYNQILNLFDSKYKVINSYIPDNIDDALDYINSYDRSELDYEIDGLVIKSNKPNAVELFGETGHHNHNAIAVKFVSQGEWTKLRNVIWTVGKEKVVPNAIFDPVDIMGSTISKATLHNIAYINALGLRINEQIKVIKANDVIPAVIEHKFSPLRNTFPIIEPINCPVCNSILEKVGDQLFCRNDDCKGKLITKIEQMASRDALNIEGLSTETIQKMIDANLLEVPSDIFRVLKMEILKLPGFAEKSADKLYKAIQGARRAKLDKFIYAAAVPLIGRRAAHDIAMHYKEFAAMADDQENHALKQLYNVEGIGEERIKSLNKHFFKSLITLSALVLAEPMETINKNVNKETLTFVITGTLSSPRRELEAAIKHVGHKISSSVSAKTNYVVTNDVESTSSKFIKAKELGIKIINENELEAILNENG